MKLGLRIFLGLTCLFLACGSRAANVEASAVATVYVLPIRDDIMPPLVYLVRRGVKAAMEHKASLLILDMDTNGGRIDTTEEIIQILGQFRGQTVTYVDHKAFSAGAFISVATQKIFMAPQSVIGAAAPLMMVPGGGPADLPQTMEAKMTSGVSALVRALAEKNGYNVDVVEAMIDKNKELIVDGEVLNHKGQILTLTNKQAEKEYGHPPKPLLSSGTVENMDALLAQLGYAGAKRIDLAPTGVERLGAWLNALSPLLLIIGVIGIYIEFKTPGFGLPGVVGIIAFTLYFLGGYVAGLSGMEWIVLFILGLVLFGLELFVFTGTAILGVLGGICMLTAIIMAMVDVYPSAPEMPGGWHFQVPFLTIALNLSLAMIGSFLAIWVLSYVLPKTSLYSGLISQTVSGEESVRRQAAQQQGRLGDVGVTISVLRPGGKAQFGPDLVDVITQGEMIDKGARVKIVGYSGAEAVVAPA